MNLSSRRNTRRQGGAFRVVVCVLALAAILVGIGSFFKISHIQVSGNVLYSEREILEAAGIEPGQNLFLLRKGDIAARILAEKRYVDAVTVKRHLPDTVEVQVRESTLLVYVETGSGVYVLNRRLEILSKGDAASVAGYIRVTGAEPVSPTVGEPLKLAEGEEAKLDYLKDVLELLQEKELYPQVQSIDLTNLASLKLQYRGHLRVILGSNESLEKKFDMLEKILADRSDNDSGTIDLSAVGAEHGGGHYIPD